MEDFTFFDFDKSPRGCVMKADEFSLNHKAQYYTITFNMEVSTMIRKGGYKYLRIRHDNITGELHFIFTKNKGLQFSTEKNHAKNITIKNKDMVLFLINKLNISYNSVRTAIKISKNLANSNEFLTFKILREH